MSNESKWVWDLFPLSEKASANQLAKCDTSPGKTISLQIAKVPFISSLETGEVHRWRHLRRKFYIPSEDDLQSLKIAFPLADPYQPSWPKVEAALVVAGRSPDDLQKYNAPTLVELLAQAVASVEQSTTFTTESRFGSAPPDIDETAAPADLISTIDSFLQYVPSVSQSSWLSEEEQDRIFEYDAIVYALCHELSIEMPPKLQDSPTHTGLPMLDSTGLRDTRPKYAIGDRRTGWEQNLRAIKATAVVRNTTNKSTVYPPTPTFRETHNVPDAECTDSDATERGQERNAVRHADLNNWGIGWHENSNWQLFHRKSKNSVWQLKGLADVKSGLMHQVLELFARNGGSAAKPVLVGALQTSGKTTHEIMESRVTPTLSKIRKAIKNAISRAGKFDEVGDPLPQPQHGSDTWIAEITVGYAVANDTVPLKEGDKLTMSRKLTLKTEEQMGR